MRVSYIPPTEIDFDRVFSPSPKGAGLNNIRVYQPAFRANGGGLLSFIGSIARRAYPINKNLVVPELGNFAKNVSDDISSGVSFKQSIKNNARRIGKNILKRAGVGGGRKRARTNQKQLVIYKKKQTREKKKINGKKLKGKCKDVFK